MSNEEMEPDIPDTEEVVEDSDYTDIEIEAMEHGWNPNGVEGKKNLSAEEYMDRKPLYDDLKAQNKKMKRMQESIDALKQFNDTISMRERAKLINQLKAAKKAALEQENYDAVVHIDERLAEAKDVPMEVPNPETFTEWVQDNQWYNQDSEMRQFADAIGTGFAENNPNLSLDDIYEHVTREVKARFPDKFGGNSRASNASAVEGASKGRRATSRRYSARDLPESDRQIMKTLVRDGVLTEQEYLKQYFS